MRGASDRPGMGLRRAAILARDDNRRETPERRQATATALLDLGLIEALDIAGQQRGDDGMLGLPGLQEGPARFLAASGPAREKMVAEMDVLSKKWAIAREKLATTLELHMHTLGEEVKELERDLQALRDKTQLQIDKIRELAAKLDEQRIRFRDSTKENLKLEAEIRKLEGKP